MTSPVGSGEGLFPAQTAAKPPAKPEFSVPDPKSDDGGKDETMAKAKEKPATKAAAKPPGKRPKAKKDGHKICSRCSKEKAIADFPLIKKDDGEDGRRRPYCNPCWPKYQQEYREAKGDGTTKKKGKKKATKKKGKKKAAKKVAKKKGKKRKTKKRKTKKKAAKKKVVAKAGAKKKKTRKKRKKKVVAKPKNGRRKKRKKTGKKVGRPRKFNGHLGGLIEELNEELSSQRDILKEVGRKVKQTEKRLAHAQKLAVSW